MNLRNIISTFELEVRGHLYHTEIIDQRAYRKWQKNSGLSYSIVEPYEFKAVCSDVEVPLELRIISNECFSKPSKKNIKAEIDYKHQRYEDACKQVIFQEEQRKEAERIKEEERLAHEAWLDELAPITNRQYEAIMHRLNELETKLNRVAEIAEDVDYRTSYHGEDE